MNQKRNNVFQFDLILILVSFMAVSLLAVYNAQQFDMYEGENFLIKQLAWFVLGTLALIAIQYLNLKQLYAASVYLYAFGIVLLLLLFFSPADVAPVINGAKSWFVIGEMTFQPAEFVKVTTIMGIASTIVAHKRKYTTGETNKDLALLFKILLLGLLPAGLVILQPDFGTFMVYLFITGILVLVSGINRKVIFALLSLLVLAVAAALLLIIYFPGLSQTFLHIEPYQVNRIETWLDFSQNLEGTDYQITRSLEAIAAGQLFGQGLGNVEVYVPEAPTDFIFAILAESFGFVGTVIVILLYFFLFLKLTVVGTRMMAFNLFASYLCFGYLAMIFIHAFQNIGMTIGIMPITGIPLMLISYGGSSIAAALLGYALIYRVSREQVTPKKKKVKRRSDRHRVKSKRKTVTLLFMAVCLGLSVLLVTLYQHMF